MGSKDTYKTAIKIARQELRDAYSDYRREVKKQRLIRKQTEIKVALELMGVWTRQIPLTYVDTAPELVAVRRG